MESSLTIEQIRSHCGYAYTTSFIKAFIRHFNVSPTQYRLLHNPKLETDT